MSRVREFDEQQALSAAQDVFWRQGYEATSIQDLVDATGVNRASLYAAFGDKQRLFQRTLARFEEQSQGALESIRGAGLRRIRAILHSVASSALSDSRGCMLINAGAELSACQDWMAEISAASRRRMERFFRGCLREAAAAGEIPASSATLAMARFLTNTVYGLRVMAKTKPSRQDVEGIVRVALSVLE